MAVLFNWWVTDLAVLLFTILTGVYMYFKHVFFYWEQRGIPFLKPSFPLGNIDDFMKVKKHMGVFYGEIYHRMRGHKVVGIYQMHRPTLLLRDLDVIRSFLVKDFSHFQDRGIYFDEKNDPISGHLVFLGGQKWKALRAKLTPTFTSGKMKMMFDEILKCGQELSECIQTHVDNGDEIEIKDVIARYSTDVIATCAFGIQCNCLKDPEAEFRQMGRQFFNPSMIDAIGRMLNIMVPTIAAITKLGAVPKDISSFFQRIVRETVEYRESNDVTRNDFMQLLIQLKNKGFVEGDGNNDDSKDSKNLTKLTLDELTAQAFVFYIAGFETSSTTVSFCLHELVLNPDIQQRLRTEITANLDKHGGQLTYEGMNEMEYLGMVIDETLRKYPPLPFLNRECNTRYTMPDTGVVIEPGIQVVVPIYGLHYDPLYYKNPHKFDPERFSREQKAERSNFTFMPFGEGPRNCIGARFGYMQTKIALVSLLSRFEFGVSSNTILKLVFNPRPLTLATKGGLYFNITNRT